MADFIFNNNNDFVLGEGYTPSFNFVIEKSNLILDTNQPQHQNDKKNNHPFYFLSISKTTKHYQLKTPGTFYILEAESLVSSGTPIGVDIGLVVENESNLLVQPLKTKQINLTIENDISFTIPLLVGEEINLVVEDVISLSVTSSKSKKINLTTETNTGFPLSLPVLPDTSSVGIDFSGTTAFLNGSVTTVEHQITSDLTIAAKIKVVSLPPNNAADWMIMQTADGESVATDTLYSLGIRNNGGTSYWSYFFEHSGGDNERIDTDIIVTVTGINQTVMIVRDVSTKSLKFIIDGVDEGDFTYSTANNGGTSTELLIGKSTSPGQEAECEIGHIAIWNAALSVTDAQKYNASVNADLDTLENLVVDISPGNLVSYYPLFGLTPNDEYDLMGVKSLSRSGTLNATATLTQSFQSPILPVAGQGYATDGTFHYIFDTTKIEKRNDDASWTVAATNSTPFASLPGSPQHVNDGAYYDGVLYTACHDSAGNTDKALVKYDAGDLSYISHVVVADSVGVAGVAVDGPNNRVYVVNFTDGTYVRVYDLNFNFVEQITSSYKIINAQGASYRNGFLYIMNKTGILFILRVSDGVVVWGEALQNGLSEYEGLDYTQDELRYIDFGGSERVRYLTGVPAPLVSSTIDIGLVVENDINFSIDKVKTKNIPINQELDIALNSSVNKIKTIELVQEIDSLLSTSIKKTKEVGVTLELDESLGVILANNTTIGILEESDSSLSITSSKDKSISIIDEVDNSLFVTVGKSKGISFDSEIDLSLPISAIKIGYINQSVEIDTVNPVVKKDNNTIELVQENDIVFAINQLKIKSIGIVAEDNISLPVISSTSKIVIINQVIESDLSFNINLVKIKSINIITELDTSLRLDNLLVLFKDNIKFNLLIKRTLREKVKL